MTLPLQIESERGVCQIVYGARTEHAHCASQTALKEVSKIPVVVQDKTWFRAPEFYTDFQKSRWAKVNLYDWSPFEYTCYLDADTRVRRRSFELGFAMLKDGWDLVLCPSAQQASEVLWHVTQEERAQTLDHWMMTPVQFQCGVLWFRRSESVRKLFAEWREQWLRFRGEDQGAFLRAIRTCPVRMWLLGFPFNGGAVIEHRWGETR